MAKSLLENSLVKKPHQKQTFTEQQLQEFQNCLDPTTGVEYFADHFCWVQHPVRGKIQYHPYKYQTELLRTYHNYKLSVNMLSRQLGKCLCEKTVINIRNKKGEIYDIPIGVFYEYNKCRKEGKEPPDISSYKRV